MYTLSQWQTNGQFIDINANQIFTKTAGDANNPALLLIHGFPSASWDWEGMWDELSKHYFLVTLDMLGFGLSDKPINAPYKITEQADLYTQFLKRLNITDVHILAHDYGDTVAQELLARQVATKSEIRINSVCFLNGGLFPHVHKPLFIQKLLLSKLGWIVPKLMSKQKFVKNLTTIFGKNTPPAPLVIDTLWALLIYNNGLRVMPMLIKYITQRKQNEQRWVGAIINSDIPVTFIAGEQDPISGKHMLEHYKKKVPNARVQGFVELGHYPQIEDAKAITFAYLNFRKQI
ncbi:alpha/beta hydrolase [Pseudoalteromonas carrageenovora]|uniref:alpha/beta fold hydrolase n=1 Tax=Pseudoalteromonas TaxID=53246 RepID=UPI000731FAE8|nr:MULTISPECIES: alpha/beta hydrolase [Pseudoalteromonas]KTF10432.1 alpha/beta hydrolase [Pseudoalteromonas sp. H103]MDO6547055.1 alpha/beta hydrolase [Pseudoalteromonas carrageenovora]MDO6636417.1 alpha/beta hydrolase [Pseudoalteromonas carrageenovora]MDO6647217.1 alpha/beta hydrolase [Pseudoalteromonas carrageenovora]MDO6831504.1 alpha/beta hydrolase [Pseudoalteromonas carrageenovora]